MIGEIWRTFCSNRISAFLMGRPSAPVIFPSIEEVCAANVAERTTEPKKSWTVTRRRTINQRCVNFENGARQAPLTAVGRERQGPVGGFCAELWIARCSCSALALL